MGRVETKKSQQEMFKKRREDKSKYNTLFYQFGGEKNRRKFKKKDGTWYEVRKDGTLKSRPPVATILGALNDGPRHPYIDAGKKSKPPTYLKNVTRLAKENIVKKKKDAKGKAQASTFDADKKENKKPTVVIKKEDKKKEKKTNFGVDTFDKSKVLKTRDIETYKTKKVPTVVEKKKEKPKTPKLKAFQGSYNKDTQKLVNIEGKTFVAPKSYEKPKSKTNPSFKKLMDKLGLRKGGHVDYRKTGLFR